MWGNKLGWGLSLVVVLLFGILLYLIKHAGDASAPTPAFKADPQNLEAISLTLEPETVVAMDEDQDAAPIYRQAMAVYGKHNHDFEDFVNTKDPKKREHMRADRRAAVISSFDDLLVPVTHYRSMRLFEDKPAEVISYDAYKYPIMDLYYTAKACDLYGLFVAQTDTKKALQYYKAAFTLGARMYHERMVHEEFRAGMLLMGEASYVLAHAKDQAERLAGATFEATSDGLQLVAAVAGAQTAATAAPKDPQLQAALTAAQASLAQARTRYVDADPDVLQARSGADAAQNFYDSSYTPWTTGSSRAARTYEFLYTFNADTLSDRVGDIFLLALKSKERLWRVEALLTLGRCRYNLGGEQHGGDQRTAVILFKKWADDPDPAISAAARAARDLSLEDFHWIRPRTLPQ